MLPLGKYPEPAQWTPFFQSVLERVGGLPGVESVAAASSPPLTNVFGKAGVEIEGRPSRGWQMSTLSALSVRPTFTPCGFRLFRGEISLPTTPAQLPRGNSERDFRPALLRTGGSGWPPHSHPRTRLLVLDCRRRAEHAAPASYHRAVRRGFHLRRRLFGP